MKSIAICAIIITTERQATLQRHASLVALLIEKTGLLALKKKTLLSIVMMILNLARISLDSVSVSKSSLSLFPLIRFLEDRRRRRRKEKQKK